MKIIIICLLVSVVTVHGHEHVQETTDENGLTPFQVELPGKFNVENSKEVSETVKVFLPFKGGIGLSWDEDFIYIQGNGLPQHPMMVGILSWQQQVPLPHNFTGGSRFKLPLNPKLIEGKPQELTLKGPIAIAVNGIPIFHALTQSGNDAYAKGELDKWGGHCGRADDYHYHIAPSHLQEKVGEGKPVAFGLDGYPIYLANPATDKKLDECHGYFDDAGNYRYIGNLTAPYMMSYFRGEADLKDRPQTHPIRPFLRPLHGASITGFSGSVAGGYSLIYAVGGKEGKIDYGFKGDEVEFNFVTPEGETETLAYPKVAPKRGAKTPPNRE